MAVDRPINPENTVPLTDESPTDVQLVEDIGAEITPTEDGGSYCWGNGRRTNCC